jgi:DNA-directed RNA polymerase subunit RPC12/RpoP
MGNRRTLCTQCNGDLEVAEQAKSVSCPHCHTRVVTEPLVVSEYVAVRRFATANRMRITKKGRVVGAVRADDLEIDGFLHGDATSLAGLRMSRTAHVTGNVRAAWLSLEPGATLVGHVRIGPREVPDATEGGGPAH